MAKASDTVVRISRKGLIVWVGLILFVAVWMFILGILVGRGIAPVNLEAGRLEKELADLKARVLRQEQSRVEARVSEAKDGAADLGFYEALKSPKKEVPFKPQTKEPDRPKSVAKPVAPKPAPAPKPKPKPVKKVATAQPQAQQANTTKGRFTVQVSALKDGQKAAGLVGELRKKGYQAYQIRTQVPNKGVWYRIRVGAFTDRRDAGKMAAKLKAQNYGAMVVDSK